MRIRRRMKRIAKNPIPGQPRSIKKRKQKKFRSILSFDVGVRNLAFCVVREVQALQPEGSETETLQTHLVQLQRWEVVDVIKEAGSRAKDVRQIKGEILVKYMIRVLPIFFDEENMAEITDVLIEQQLRRGMNNVALAYTIMTFFLTRFPRLEKKVHLINAKEKFRIVEHGIPDMVMQEIKDGKRPKGRSKKSQQARYRSNKRLGKKAIEKELKEEYLLVSDDIAAKFKGGKRDDLADCLLQALVKCHPDVDLLPDKVGNAFEEYEESEMEIDDLEPIDPDKIVDSE